MTNSKFTKRATLADVAATAGVAKSTVLAALKPGGGGKCARVSEAKAELIRRVAQELGYQPNPIARGLRGGKTRSVACIWRFVDSYCMDGNVGSQILERLQAQGNATYQVNHPDTIEDVLAVLEDLKARRIDILIYNPSHWMLDQDTRIMQSLTQFRSVVLVVPWAIENCPFDQVVHARDSGICDVVAHFALQKCQSALIIANPQDSTDRHKIEVFTQECIAHGIDKNSVSTLPVIAISKQAEGRIVAYRSVLQKGLDGKDVPDAILCVNDVGVMVVANYLKSRGLTVGEDVSLVGLNDPIALSLWNPPLATINRNHDELLHAVLEVVEQKQKNPENEPLVRIVPMRFIARASAGFKLKEATHEKTK